MWRRRTQFRWLPKRPKMRRLSRRSRCYIKRLPKIETWKRHCDPQIYKDFIRRCSQTFTTFFRPVRGFICNCKTDPPPQSSRPLPPWDRKIRLPIDQKTEVEYLKYILNYCLTRLDILDEIISENPVPRDAPSSDKTSPPPQTTQEQKKMKPQSRILSLLYNSLHLQLQMMTKWNWILPVLKDISMRIARKRNPPILFHLREQLLVRQPVGRMHCHAKRDRKGRPIQDLHFLSKHPKTRRAGIWSGR